MNRAVAAILYRELTGSVMPNDERVFLLVCQYARGAMTQDQLLTACHRALVVYSDPPTDKGER